ncbi:MAG: hypothetical protein IJ156_08340 [Bacteroidales bacterium]|nr:hypothetical protein [Bacteroidales bacterium]
MDIPNSQREENYQEYSRLLQDPLYIDVIFDEESGGVSAIHKEHCFDKQKGPYGYARGQYEKDVAHILRKNGDCIILESEYPKGKGIKAFDARLNGLATEIKTVESTGRWSVRTKIQEAITQGAEILILYYPEKDFFSEDKIHEGWRICFAQAPSTPLQTILVVMKEEGVKMLKPSG